MLARIVPEMPCDRRTGITSSLLDRIAWRRGWWIVVASARRILKEIVHQAGVRNRHTMALYVHALDEAVIEAVLHAATRNFSSLHSLQSAQCETNPRANASPVSAVGSSAYGCAEYGADRRAAHAAVCCR